MLARGRNGTLCHAHFNLEICYLNLKALYSETLTCEKDLDETGGQMSRFEEMEDARAIQRRPSWPLFLLLLGLLGGLAYLLEASLNALEPRRVLVAVSIEGLWAEGSSAAAAFTDRLNDQLEEQGFLPLRGGDPQLSAALEEGEELLEVARRFKAAFLLSGEVLLDLKELPIEGGYHEGRYQAELQLQHLDEKEGMTLSFKGWGGARELESLRNLLGRSAADRALGLSLPPLIMHPNIQQLLKEDAETIAALQPAQNHVAAHNQGLRNRRLALKALMKRRERNQRGPAPLKFHGQGDEEDGLCGGGPWGYLVKTEAISAHISSKQMKMSYREELETLERYTPKGTRESLWSGYNLYGYPGVSKDGRVLAFSEDLFGWAKTVTLLGDELRRLQIDPESRFSELRPSWRARYLALYRRSCPRCPQSLLILETKEGQERFHKPAAKGRFGGFAWLGDQRFLFAYTPAPPEPEEKEEGKKEIEPKETPECALWLMNLEGKEAKPSLLRALSARCSWLASGPKGERAVMLLSGAEQALGILDISTGRLQQHPLEGRASAPLLMEDGRLILSWIPPGEADEEIALLDLDGELHRLTQNDQRDRYPQRVGDRIYFESLGMDPDFPRRQTSLIASLPLPSTNSD